jgi:hypothetical protein
MLMLTPHEIWKMYCDNNNIVVVIRPAGTIHNVRVECDLYLPYYGSSRGMLASFFHGFAAPEEACRKVKFAHAIGAYYSMVRVPVDMSDSIMSESLADWGYYGL